MRFVSTLEGSWEEPTESSAHIPIETAAQTNKATKRLETIRDVFWERIDTLLEEDDTIESATPWLIDQLVEEQLVPSVEFLVYREQLLYPTGVQSTMDSTSSYPLSSLCSKRNTKQALPDI
jgi:hypothetical protein